MPIDGAEKPEWFPMKKYALAGLGAMILMTDGYDLQSIGFAAPEIARAWMLKLASFGPIFSAGLAGTIPGAMLAGPLAHRFGHRSMLLVALLVFGGGSLAAAATTGLTGLAIVRFVTGLGLGAAVPLVLTLVAVNTPARFRATLTTLVLCGQPLGALFGAALCTRLIPLFGWQAAFIAGGVFPLAVLPALVAFPQDIPREAVLAGAKTAMFRRVRELVQGNQRATTLSLWAAAFLGSVVVYIIISWLPGLVRASGYSLRASMTAIGSFNLGGIAGAIGLGVASDRWGALRVVPVSFGCAAFFLALMDVSRQYLPLLVAISLLSGIAGYGAGASMGAVSILSYPPALGTTGVGWVLGISRIGAATSPLLVGFALNAGMPKQGVFYMAAAAAVGASLCLAFLARKRRRAAGVAHGG